MADWSLPPDFEQPAFRAFEAYGYAMASASVFEIVLRLVLMEAKAKELPRIADEERRQIEQEKFCRKVFRANFGALIQRVIDKCKLSADLQADLRNARDARDHLAHFFWQAHLGSLTTEQGIDLIGAECNLTAHFFNEAADKLRHATGVNTEQYKQFVRDRGAELFHKWPLADLVQ